MASFQTQIQASTPEEPGPLPDLLLHLIELLFSVISLMREQEVEYWLCFCEFHKNLSMPRGYYLNVVCECDRQKKKKKKELRIMGFENYGSLIWTSPSPFISLPMTVLNLTEKNVIYLNLIELAYPMGAD